MVTKSLFGILDSTEVYAFEIKSDTLCATVIEYGAILQSLVFKNTDCVLGFDTLEGYIKDVSNQGATVGRYANRIGGAQFVLNNKLYTLDKNDNDNCLHGGATGFGKRIYSGEQTGENSVTFKIHSPSGEGGFPATLDCAVTFTVLDSTLKIEYNAISDADTIVNFTNHAYFNLGSPDIKSTKLTINADSITPVDKYLIPTGELMSVKGSAFDFTTPRAIGEYLDCDEEQIVIGNGYDHNFVLGDTKCYRKNCVRAFCPESNITMYCSTDMPGVQLYTANFLDEKCGKNNNDLIKNMGFCLETQFWPDTPNKTHFPSCKLYKNETFTSITEYSFE